MEDFRSLSISGNYAIDVRVPDSTRWVRMYGHSDFLALIKEELGTREHINNKLEAKIHRRKLAEATRGQGKNKNR